MPPASKQGRVLGMKRMRLLNGRTKLLKDRKRRPEGSEWEPRISFEIFSRCAKITAKHKQVLEAELLKPTGDMSK